MKLEIESSSGRIIRLAAKTVDILEECKGSDRCKDCRWAYVRNPDTEPDLGCKVADVEKVIVEFPIY